jgi:hypothetical protein
MRNRRDRPGRVVGEGNAALGRNAVILAVHGKPIDVGIAPAHADWDGVVEVGNALSLRSNRRRPIIGLTPRSTTLNWYTQTNCGLGAWENNIDKLLSVLSRNAQVV